MQVFKAYLKVLRGCLPTVIMYLCIFLTLAVAFSYVGGPDNAAGFEETRVNVTIINRDKPSPIVQGLTDSIERRHTLVSLPDDEQILQEKLSYRMTAYILIIPAGFSDRFTQEDAPPLDCIRLPDEMTGVYLERQINTFLENLRRNLVLGEMDQQQAVQQALAADQLETQADSSEARSAYDMPRFAFYYRYMAYIVTVMMILVLGTILTEFTRKELRARNLCSPLPQRRQNLQLAAGTALFALVCWGGLVLLSIALYRGELLSSPAFPYLCLNAFALTAMAAGIGFLVGTFVHNFNAMNAVANVVSLGMSFLCGVFVPQFAMSEGVLRFSTFLPLYWYTKASDTLGQMTVFDASTIQTVLVAILIQLGFAAAIFSVALFLSRFRREAK